MVRPPLESILKTATVLNVNCCLQASIYSNSAAGVTYSMDLNTNPILATLPDPGLSGKIDIFQPCSLKARFILLTSHQGGGNGGALSPPVALTRSMCADTARSSPRQQVLIRSLWYFPAPNFKISVDAMRWCSLTRQVWLCQVLCKSASQRKTQVGSWTITCRLDQPSLCPKVRL